MVCSKVVFLAVATLLILYRQISSPIRIKDDSQSSSRRQAMIQDPLKIFAAINQGVILVITSLFWKA